MSLLHRDYYQKINLSRLSSRCQKHQAKAVELGYFHVFILMEKSGPDMLSE